MSLTTWTPAALSAEASRLAGACWRLVESQHRVSILKLVDSLEQQDLLESLIEDSEPPVPEDCRDLHYLLSTPFRTGAAYPTGSRFRRPGRTAGVYYASHEVATAVAEMAFYKLLFFAESPDTPWPPNPAEYTAFCVPYAGTAGIDLTAPPFDGQAHLWCDPVDLAACQDLADTAREAAVSVIRYRSARDPGGGVNVALMACSAFATKAPDERQGWRIRVGAFGAQAVCEAPDGRLSFDRQAFARDPRVATMGWQRPRVRL